MRTHLCLAAFGVSATIVALQPPPHSNSNSFKRESGPTAIPYTHDFGLENSPILVNDGGNAYMSLTPGNFYRYEGFEDNEFVEVEVTVRRETRPMVYQVKGKWKFAIAAVVEEREWIEGDLAEVTLNYYARCPESNNIFYMGEFVEHYEEGVVVDNDGSWLAGVDGAEPGLLVPSLYLLGARYCQENAPGTSMDRGENVAMGISYRTPAGKFSDCIVIEETSPLEPDEITLNIYAPGVGPVADGPLKLVEYIVQP